MSDTRLIDANLLETNIAQIARKCARSDAQKALVGRILFMIENMPAIEAQPVKRGSIERLTNAERYETFYKSRIDFDGRCSECGSFVFDTDKLCSWCGAVFHNEEDGGNNG